MNRKRIYQLLPLLVLALLLAVLLAAQSGLAADSGGDSEAIAQAIAVQEAHADVLMARSDVVGIAVGARDNGQATIRLYVLADNAVGLPTQLDGIPVETVVTGMFHAFQTTDRHRPAPIGVSVGHPDITAGTIGARVIDGQGNVYILSNNHVLANSNDAQIGDSALQPGPFDGGSDPADKIGELHDFETILFNGPNNIMDAAIASSSTDVLLNSTLPGGYGVPGTDVVNATVGLSVQKCGRTTGCTTGSVSSINAIVDVCYVPLGPICLEFARFVNQFTITPGSFSAGGDSGSLIVTNDGANNPVGLLFAGSTSMTIANPIGPVLDRFNVTIDGSSDPGPTPTHTATPDPDVTPTNTPQATPTRGRPPTVTPTHTATPDPDVTPTNTPQATPTRVRPGTATPGTPTATPSATPTQDPDPGEITLTAVGYLFRGLKQVDLSWNGATTTTVDVYRNGVLIVTTPNDGFYTDNLGRFASGSYTYQVCESGSTTECSNEAQVDF